MKASKEEVFWKSVLIVDAYREVLEEASGFALPQSALPLPKNRIRDAIKILLLCLGNEAFWNTLRNGKIPIPKRMKEVIAPSMEAEAKLVVYLLTDKFYNSVEVGYISLARFIPDKDADVHNKLLQKISNRQANEITFEEARQLASELASEFDDEKITEITRRIKEESSALLDELRGGLGKSKG